MGISMLKRNTQSGFGIVGVIIIVVVLGIIGSLGWVVYKNFVQKPSSNLSQTNTSASQTTSVQPAPQSDLPSGWTWCVDTADGFKFAHPVDWKFDLMGVQSGWTSQAQAYDKGDCSAPGGLAPQAQLTYIMNKYGGNNFGPLLSYSILPHNAVYDTVNKLHDLYVSEYDSYSQAGYTPKPASLFTINGLSASYVNQNTNSYSDNWYDIELKPGVILEFYNRESDKHYTASTPPKVDDQNDYTQYTPTIEQIVKTVHAL